MAQSKIRNKTNIKKKLLFDEQTKDLLKSYDLIKFDLDKVDKLKEDLVVLARSVYPDKNIKVYLCGSRVTGMAKYDSDVDLYMDIGDTFDGSICENIGEQAVRVGRIHNAMLCDKKFQVILPVTTGRIPILKFKHIEMSLNCDLSFRSGMSTKSSELVKFYLDWDPRVKYVVAGVKVFMEEHGLADFTLYNSYAQVWLALFFLMQPDIGLIPSLLCLRILSTQIGPQVTPSMVEYWDVTVPVVDKEWKKKWIKKKCKLSGEQLLEKFFTFYSSLPPLESEFVLTAYNGMITKKKKVFQKSRMPIRRFYAKYRTERGQQEFLAMQKKYKDDIKDRFYLQDPFHQLKNLTKLPSAKASKEQMVKFVERCEMMVQKLSD